VPPSSPRHDQIVTNAAMLARDIAPELGVVLLTHYPDADTLDIFRPGGTDPMAPDLATIRAVNQAVAAEMLEAGVKVLVQKADRAAFRRWMADREDTAENRAGWIDRNRLLQGAAALDILGVSASAAPPRRVFASAPGPVADRLLDAYSDEDSSEFDALVQALMAETRTDILDLAVRKLSERDGDEAGDELNWVLLVAAEGAAIGPSGWAELVALPVALSSGPPPDGEALGQSFGQNAAFPDTDEIRLLPGWRSPDALAGLSFAAIRRVLTDMLAGIPPRDLPPGDTDELARRGFGLLLGLRIDWDIPIWDQLAAMDRLPDDDAEDAASVAEQTRLDALFDQWRAKIFQESQGCVPLALVALSEVAEEVAAFLAEAGDQTGGLEEIRDFVGVARKEAGGEDIVCQPEAINGTLQLSLYTAGGRFLDSLTLLADRLPVPAEQMPPLIEAFVRLK
jgi:hypothetical protein